MDRFIHDMIHMTEGEKLVTYWPLWLVIAAVLIAADVFFERREKRDERRHSDRRRTSR